MQGHGRRRPFPMATPQDPHGLKRQQRGPLALGSGPLVLVLAVVIGLQLGALPWRYRREFWQLQGALVGAAVGFVIGRFTAGGRSRPEEP